MDAALGFVDEAIETLFYGLRKRGILDCVNVMLVSDHGEFWCSASTRGSMQCFAASISVCFVIEVKHNYYFNFFPG